MFEVDVGCVGDMNEERFQAKAVFNNDHRRLLAQPTSLAKTIRPRLLKLSNLLCLAY